VKRLQSSLKESSLHAFLLALEIINKVTVPYRLEAFTILFVNAWELLLKFYLVTQGQKIYYRKRRGLPRRSLSLRDCLTRVFTSSEDPLRLNIEGCEELRDCAVHLFIPVIPADVMGLFQAGVINYAKKLKEWTGEDLSDRVPLGMMALIYDFDPRVHSLDSALVRRKMSAEAIKWVKGFQTGIRAKAALLGKDQQHFYVPIELKLAIVKNPGKSDIILGSGSGGVEAIVVEVPKNSDATHPFRQKEVLEEVLRRCHPVPSPNAFDVLVIRRLHKIDIKPEYFYKSKFGVPQYSVAFVDWIDEQYRRDAQFFSKAREKYRTSLSASTERAT
jgi:hypothetical protein